jgi:hypothetical protein
VRSGSGDYENATRVPGTGDWLESLDRREVPKRMGEIEERIEGATSEIRISGIDCKRIEAASRSLADALKERPGLRVQIMCVDPLSPVAEALG